MDYEVAQSIPAIRSSILNGDLPWSNEDIFDQWFENFTELVRAECALIALSRGHHVPHVDEQNTIILEALRSLAADEYDS